MKERVCTKCLGSGELEDLELVNDMYVHRGYKPCEFCSGTGYGTNRGNDSNGKKSSLHERTRKILFGWGY